MFCWTAPSWIFFCASGLSAAASRSSPAASVSRSRRSGNDFSISVRALTRSASSRKRTTTLVPSRATPEYCTFFSRSSERMSVVYRSAALSSAAFMSTCSRKCTPPRRSRPRYIGLAPIAVSHCGDADSRLSATM